MPRFALIGLRLVAVSFMLALSGCAAWREGAGATEIVVSTPLGEQVEKTVRAVFGEHGYTQTSSDRESLTFERPGSRADAVMYADFSEGKVTDRVRVVIDPLEIGKFRITCVGYAVREPTGRFEGDASLSDPIRRFQFFSSQSRRMLQEVKNRLR